VADCKYVACIIGRGCGEGSVGGIHCRKPISHVADEAERTRKSWQGDQHKLQNGIASHGGVSAAADAA